MEITKGINVLSIGSDMSIIKPDSEANKRMKEYGTLANRLDIAIYNGSFFGESDEAVVVSANVFAYPRSFWGLLSLFKVNSKKLSFVLNHRIDLITVQDPFYLGLIGLRLAKWLRAAFHVQIHTDLFDPYFKKESLKSRFKVFIAKRVIKEAQGIRVVSNKIKDSLKKNVRLNAEPLVLPIWVPARSIRDSSVKVDLKKKYPEFDIVLLMASRITIEKNIAMMIKTMRKIVGKFPKVGLVIVGSGPLKDGLIRLVKSYGLEKNVIFEDWSEDLPSYYKSSDIFINTSNYEGYGRTIVEALSAGEPVITTDVGCAKEEIRDGENGFIIPVADLKALENVIVDILGDPELMKKIKENAGHSQPEYRSKEEYLEMYARSWSECLK